MRLDEAIETTRAAAAAVVVAAAIMCCWCASASASPFFAAHSPWNAQLPRETVPARNSRGLVAELSRQVATFGPWVNSHEFSVPIYTVPADQPALRVQVDTHHDMYSSPADAARLGHSLGAVPIPPGAKGARGTDMHMVIWQPSTDTMWELWQARNPAEGGISNWRDNSPGWHASWGAKITRVSRSKGIVPAPYGATATGLAAVGGLVTVEDLAARRIDHALALAIPDTAAGRFVAPATRTDGAYRGRNAIPAGTRFRLPASVDVDALRLPPVTRMMARAAQRYGIVVRDRAGAVTFYAEDTTRIGSSLFRQLLGRQNPGQALQRFPWDQLEVVAPGRAGSPQARRPARARGRKRHRLNVRQPGRTRGGARR